MTHLFHNAPSRQRDLLDVMSTGGSGIDMTRLRALADTAGMTLLLLVVGSLLVRPADLIPALEGAPIYEALVIACLAVSLQRITNLLSLTSLRDRPVVAFALLLIPAVMLSHLVGGYTWEARMSGLEMAKACIFFVLVVAQVDTRQRLHAMLAAVTGCVFVVAMLATCQAFGLIALSGLEAVQQRVTDPFTGEPSLLYRLCGIGVFNDPNDFSLVLVGAMILCGYGLSFRHQRRSWLLLLIPLIVCGVALYLTRSRGGMVAAAGGAIVFTAVQLGRRNTLALAVLCLPLIAIALLGRATPVDGPDPSDTFQTRLELWSESFDVFRAAPIFGLGQSRLPDEIGQVTHNSFLHAYAEMGLVGGTVFFGSFYLLLRGLWNASPVDAELAKLRPYMLAMLAAYVAGILSLSRCYAVPTQLMLGLGAAFLSIQTYAGQHTLRPMGLRCLGRVGIAGTMFLGVTYLFLRVMLQRGPA